MIKGAACEDPQGQRIPPSECKHTMYITKKIRFGINCIFYKNIHCFF